MIPRTDGSTYLLLFLTKMVLERFLIKPRERKNKGAPTSKGNSPMLPASLSY